MTLTQLILTRFRSYADVTLDLRAPRILVAGVNGSGKTGIKNGIRWALTGHCEGTDARGAGAEVLIPTGLSGAEVSVAIDGLGTAQRTFNGSGGTFAVDAFTGTSQIQQQALYIKLGTTPEFLEAVLDTEAFLQLSHVEGKALVLSLLGVRFQMDGPDGPSLSLDQLDAKYRQAFEDRKHAKKFLEQSKILPAEPAGPMPSLEVIETQLQKVRGELADLRGTVGETVGRRAALVEEDRRLHSLLQRPVGEDRSAQIEALEAKIASLEAVAVPVPTTAPAKGDPNRLTFLRSSLERLQRHEPRSGCVLDAAVPCKTATGAFTARVADLSAELKGLDPRPETPAPAVTQSPLTAARRELQTLQQQQALVEATIATATKADARRLEIRQELDGLPNTAAQEAALATLEGRIQKGEQLQRTARDHWGALEVYKNAVTRLQMAQTEVTRLETLVEQLGPKGIRVQALSQALGTFEAAVNPYLQPFGWTVTFSLDPWDVLANGRPVETYSRSERYRIGIALQLAIASLSGLKFAVVDEIDMLDVANRAIVTKMLLSAPLEQILILGTRETKQELPRVPGVLAYRLTTDDNGRTAIAERVPTEAMRA